jgi:PKD repeat protein
MDILGDILKGIAPIEITFSLAGTVIKFVKWLWYFGDGSFSTEKEPKHTYVAPGIYTVSLTVTDEFGNIYTFTKIDYIYVYGYPIGATGLVSGYTDVCYRHAVKSSQGQGITPFSDRWVWPMVLCATAKGYTQNHENLSLVINAEDMKIYRIGIPEVWTDREGTYEEAEIPTNMKLPEIVSRYGEQENVRHVETHALMRSWDELNYRGKAGYTSEGLRNAQELSIEVYQSGEQIVPTTKLRKVNNGGDYAFMKEVEARRIQLKLKTTTSAFRITRVAAHCQELDHRTPPQLNDIPEKRWQREFSAPDLWFSRNKPSINTNRGDLTLWTGAGIAVTR